MTPGKFTIGTWFGELPTMRQPNGNVHFIAFEAAVRAAKIQQSTFASWCLTPELRHAAQAYTTVDDSDSGEVLFLVTADAREFYGATAVEAAALLASGGRLEK